eukprot:gene2855-4244_t
MAPLSPLRQVLRGPSAPAPPPAPPVPAFTTVCTDCDCGGAGPDVEGVDYKTLGAAGAAAACWRLTRPDAFCSAEFVWTGSACYCRARAGVCSE